MIVQTIEISLSKGRAPDLLAHVAESGREIEMIPDVELFADDYIAEIDTVKPDGTFTMTNCTINADGNIIAPITEQAVAVKGLCHYIIKIFNDNVVIYSACGSLWVDDHLITDDMIESIAEVNGYRFPQDFATIEDIPTTEDFIDDNSIELEKTWSSYKINDEISKAVLEKYDNDERIIGTWFNKPLYSKSALLSSSDIHNGDYQKYMDIIADNPDMVIVTCAYIINSYNELIPLPYLNNTSIYCGYFIQRLTDRIRFQLRYGASYPSSGFAGAILSVKYTKTTD